MTRTCKSVTHSSTLGLSTGYSAHEWLPYRRAVLGASEAASQSLLLDSHLANSWLIKAVRGRLISLGNDFLDSDFVSGLISSTQLNGVILSRSVKVLDS